MAARPAGSTSSTPVPTISPPAPPRGRHCVSAAGYSSRGTRCWRATTAATSYAWCAAPTTTSTSRTSSDWAASTRLGSRGTAPTRWSTGTTCGWPAARPSFAPTAPRRRGCARRRARGRYSSSAAHEAVHDPELIVERLVAAESAHRALLDESTAPRRHAERTRHALAVLAACTDRDTGAVIASPTTSLPEVVRGDRQFDYRYSWLRDSSVAITVASLLGRRDASGALHGVPRSARTRGNPRVAGAHRRREADTRGARGRRRRRLARLAAGAGGQRGRHADPVRLHRFRRRRDLPCTCAGRASSRARPGRSCARWPIGPPNTTVSPRTESGRCASRRRWSRPTSGVGSRSTAPSGSRAVIDPWSGIAGRGRRRVPRRAIGCSVRCGPTARSRRPTAPTASTRRRCCS